jgi:hypothetical protein
LLNARRKPIGGDRSEVVCELVIGRNDRTEARVERAGRPAGTRARTGVSPCAGTVGRSSPARNADEPIGACGTCSSVGRLLRCDSMVRSAKRPAPGARRVCELGAFPIAGGWDRFGRTRRRRAERAMGAWRDSIRGSKLKHGAPADGVRAVRVASACRRSLVRAGAPPVRAGAPPRPPLGWPRVPRWARARGASEDSLRPSARRSAISADAA